METSGSSFARDARSIVRTLPGRLFVLSTGILLALFAIKQIVELPEIGEVFRKVVSLAWFVSAVWLAVIFVSRNSGRLLWRVREKLILSYVFLGFVPVLLVVSLTFVSGLVAYQNVAGYMFHEGFTDIADDVQQIAETSASEIGRTPAGALETINRKYLTYATRYPMLSVAVVPLPPPAKPELSPVPAAPVTLRPSAPAKPEVKPPPVPLVTAGPWRHLAAPSEVPGWLRSAPSGFRAVIGVQQAGATEWTVVIRSAVQTRDESRLIVVDLPVDADIAAVIEARTKERIGPASLDKECGGSSDTQSASPQVGMFSAFQYTVAMVECRDWRTGDSGRAAFSLDAPLGRLWSKVAANNSFGKDDANRLVILLVALALLFLVIQGAAVFFGALLARTITFAIHELFTGTERVQVGDFAHRIKVNSGDQLGELARSFNRMSAAMEHALHVQREKQRLDDELRIAREIQQSLLPASPPVFPFVSIADLCEPAREVGGDYYDFFTLGPRQFGVMIADVSGKGTSAALYMAELKGLMLSLSAREQSPRDLMIEANRLLSAHLDNRSFITMTYMVIDLDARTMTCARAGHTPLLIVSGGQSEVVIPSGMVLGLRLPGAAERFSQVLEEHTRAIRPGDVFVLYTDGISEATDINGELFGDAALARVVASHHALDAPGIRERVVREVRSFVGDAEPHDDMTMIVVKFEEPEAA